MFLGDLTWETLALAALVGLIAGIVGLSLRYGVQTWLDEFVGLIRDVVRWAGGRASTPRIAAPPWFCVDCHSANLASARYCYRGCGLRDDLEDQDPLGVHAPPDTRAGTARRRG